MNRLLCATLLALLACTAQAAGLAASVDRTHLDQGDDFELTLESQDATLFGKPDLAPLQGSFEVLGTRQVNRLTSFGGSARATTRWTVTLRPKSTGKLVIPPLHLGEASSEPIEVYVAESAPDAQHQLEPVFIDASLDKDSVYVQAQAILTLRIYHSVSLYDDSTLTPLQMDGARVEQLGEPRLYDKVLNGVSHGVIEVRYAIFPQRSGALTIPGLSFTATLVDSRQNDDDFMPFGARPGKVVRVQSPDIPLQVKPKPDSYPADAPWLPASAVSLSESWTPEPDTAQPKVGDSLTRSLTLRAEGLSSAQLPPLQQASSETLRRYPEQPRLSDQEGDRGIIGSREQSEALVPTRGGQLDVPAVDVVWWNTQLDRLEHTTLDARRLDVADNLALQVDTPVTGSSEAPPPLWPWQLSSLLLACTTLLGFALWWRARRQPAIPVAAQSGPSPRTLLDDLRKACQANDPQATRQALDAWARQQPETLAAMAARFEPLSVALDGLNGALYSETGKRWEGEDLWQAIRSLPPRPDDEVQEPGPLPPLYPR